MRNAKTGVPMYRGNVNKRLYSIKRPCQNKMRKLPGHTVNAPPPPTIVWGKRPGDELRSPECEMELFPKQAKGCFAC